MNERRIDELLAGRALHALTPEETRAIESIIADSDDVRERADFDQDSAALLAQAVAPVQPPAHIRASLLATIARTPQDAEPAPAPAETAPPVGGTDAQTDAASPAPRPEAAPASQSSQPPAAEESVSEPVGPARRPKRAWFALAASFLVIAAGGTGITLAVQHAQRPAGVVALDRVEDAADAQSQTVPLEGGGTMEVHWSLSQQTAVAVLEQAPTLDEGSQYQLWFIRDETPLPAGVVDGGTRQTAVLEGEMHAGDIVAVTVEAAGGSPTGLPTTDAIAAVPTL